MNRSSRHLGSGLALGLALALLVVAVPAAAQTDVTTGRIAGQVLDSEGQPLPGVSVEAKNKGTGLTLVQVTDARGLYRIVNVPVGEYTLAANLSGFQKQTREKITITVGAAVTADFKLTLSTVAESVTVTAEAPTIETTQTASQTTVDNQTIQALPLLGRNFTDFALTTPNVQRDPSRGNLALGGQRGISTNVTVDGVDATNAFFGGVSGAAEGRAPISISQESVREFQVIQSGASAEFGRSAGGFVNVLTKSGTNDFHGSAFFYMQPSDTTARLANGIVTDSEKQNLGASIGGPILKDRLFFFANYEQQRKDTSVPLTDAFKAQEPLILAKYTQLPSTGATYTQTQDADAFFGRFDVQASDKHRVYLRANYTDYEGLNGTSGAQTRSISYNGIENNESLSAVLSWNGMFGANLINDLNLQYATDDTPRDDKGLNLPDMFSGVGNYGEVSFLPITAASDRITVGDSLTMLFGAHVAKAGVEYNDTGMDQAFKGNWRGVYTFSNTQGMLDGKWTQYREFYSLDPDCLAGRKDFSQCASDAGRYDHRQKEYAVFVQDQWFATPQLTVSLGVRYEYQDNPNDPVLDVNKVLTPGARSVQPDATIPDATNQWSPRLSFSFSPEKSGKSVLRLSLGRYWARFPALLTAQLYTSNGVRAATTTITAGSSGPGAATPLPWGPTFCPPGGTCWAYQTQALARLLASGASVTAPAPGVTIIPQDFKNPYTDRISFNAERDFFGIAVGLEAAYAATENLQRISDRNLYAGSPTDCPAGANGLVCYGKLVSGRITPNRINTNYSTVTVYESDARSRFSTVSLSLRKNLANGLRFYTSATWAQDKDNDSNERNFGGFFIEDLYNVEGNYGYSDRDMEWRFTANGSYEKKLGPVYVNAGALYFYETGRPYTGITNADLNYDGQQTTDRATVGGEHFERNSFRQPDQYRLDARLGFGFDLGPGRLQLLGEMFNVTNTANRSVPFSPNQRWGTGQTPLATFGQASNVTSLPRTLQFSLRYDF